MKNSASAIAAMLILAAVSTCAAAGLEKQKDGGYRFANDLYQATIDPQGRLMSLTLKGEEMFSHAYVNSKAIGASFIGGANSRMFLPTPNITIEANMVVARGDGREVSYRFNPDGLDFLFDVKARTQWTFHFKRKAITHLVKETRKHEVVPLSENGSTAAVLASNGYRLAFTPIFFTAYYWAGKGYDTPDIVSGAYIVVNPSKSEAQLRITKHSGWAQNMEVLAITGERADHLFPKGKPVQFAVTLRNRSAKDYAGVLNVIVTNHIGVQPTQTFRLPVKTPAKGEATVTWHATFNQPLVSKTMLNLKAGKETVLTKDLVFAYDAEHYRLLLTRPDDFTAFWDATRKELRGRPLNLKVTPAPELSNTHRTISKVSFTSLGRRIIVGWLTEPATPYAKLKARSPEV